MDSHYQAGLKVGEYLLEEMLGRGAFAEVWRARHCVWPDKKTAVKLATAPDYIRHLRNEGRLASELRHPNIITVLGLDPWAEPPYLILELVQGPSLDQMLRALAPRGLPVEAALTILRGVLNALVAAHAKQVIHCDLKPGNVLLHLAGRHLSALAVEAVKVGDFGLALGQLDPLRSLAQSASFDRRDKLVGTLAYMAPEVRDGGQPDARSDLYSAGVILFEMLAGERPTGLDPLSRYRPDLPDWLDTFVARLCAKHEWRYESAALALRDLLALARDIQFAPPGLSAAPSTPPLVRESVPPPARESVPASPAAGTLSRGGDAREKISALREDEKKFPSPPPPPLPGLPSKGSAPRRTPVQKSPSRWRRRLSAVGALILAGWLVGKVNWSRPTTKPADLTLRVGAGAEMELMSIPAGEFADDSGRVRQISRPFYLGKHEVTQAQWRALMGDNPSRFQGDNLPVDSVSWNECQEFCKRLAARAGRPVRLPTEAEWEYACRAGARTPYHFGQTISLDKAHYDAYNRNKRWRQTLPVGSFSANAWGLHDMHGNVWEWCQDWFDQNSLRSRAPLERDPTGPKGGTGRVLCGGSWVSVAENCRAGTRAGHPPDGRLDVVGFRVWVAAGP